MLFSNKITGFIIMVEKVTHGIAGGLWECISEDSPLHALDSVHKHYRVILQSISTAIQIALTCDNDYLHSDRFGD